jgi:CubicO group peptidase (beta-lactamase class C family)
LQRCRFRHPQTDNRATIELAGPPGGRASPTIDTTAEEDCAVRFLAILALGISAALSAGGPGAAIENVIDREMPASGAPGLTYAVVNNGEITSVGARGVVEMYSDAGVTPESPFLTGSISKSFTALAVMQLVEAGQVDLDSKVARYLDAFSSEPAGKITIRQLLSHTSGYSTLQGNTSHTDATGDPDELARRVDQLAEVTPAASPGEKWQYSNANYAVLGRLIEVVDGRDYESYVTTKILEPVGMADSFVSDGQAHESMVTGHTPWFVTKRPLPVQKTQRSTAPQGGIVASAGDLARYLQVMMNGQDDVLSADGKALMMRPASEISPLYGFGWFVNPSNGTVWHSGASPGFETLATMVPSERKGVVVLVNAGSGVGFGETTQLRNAITAEALGLDYSGEGSRLPQKALFIALVSLPIVYLFSTVWAWRHRAAIRAKSGAAGLFSLWFPLLTTSIAAWVMLSFVPQMMGAPLSTIRLFQPDLGLALIASSVAGVAWAVFRLGLAYTGPSHFRGQSGR